MVRTLSVAVALLLAVGAGAQKSVAELDKKELATIAKLDAAYVAAKKAYSTKATPQNRSALIAAAMKLADTVLVSPALSPKDKYPRSLRAYREVKKLDPKHIAAQEKIELIEGIYRSMGRPIPK